ncbi:MAG: hypothetical protein NTV34_15200, partial [Proteobacteria bacterium]|nr:hypothetical protein [Pseudomonadota bacterium]
MRKTWTCQFILILLLIQHQVAIACSAFSPEASPFFGANYDWKVPGGMILINPEGLVKSAFLAPKDRHRSPAIWSSVYASVTLTQWGREFPVQGLNTAGLAGVLLNGPAEWPAAGPKGFISEQQWLQYQLDNFATVAEVAEHIDDLGIAGISGKLQYFFCDQLKDCAWISFVGGQGAVHLGQNLPMRAISNASFGSSNLAWETFVRSGSGFESLPTTYDAIDRFVRAAWFSQQRRPTSDDVHFGLSNLAGRGWTNWQTVFDLDNIQLSVRPTGSTDNTIVTKKEFNMKCYNPKRAQHRTINKNTIASWSPYQEKDAQRLLEEASRPALG